MNFDPRRYRSILFKSSPKRRWLSFVLLFIGIALTLITAVHTKKNLESQLKNEFALTCNEIKTKISIRLHSHAQLLRSGSSLFAVLDTVSRQNWKLFYDNMKINKNLPGIQGFGYSYIIPQNKLKEHIQQIQKEGFPSYGIRPKNQRDTYTSIIYLEPFADRNLRAFGYDMYSEPIRRKAMEQARDFDVAALSGKVTLVQETEKDLQAGTLMYVPVYHKGMPTNTVEERRAAIIGWVYSPYRMRDLMDGILGRWDNFDENRIWLQIYDDDIISKNTLLFDSQRKDTTYHNNFNQFTIRIPIVFNDKKWTLNFLKSNEPNYYLQSRVLVVLFSGLTISFLLFSLSLSLFNTRRRAQGIAEELTTELNESKKRLENYINSTSDIVFTLDTEQRHIGIYGDWAEQAGLSKAFFLGRTAREIMGDDSEIHEQANQRALNGEHVVYQWSSTNGGNTNYYQTSLSPLYRENKIIGIIGIGRDISELKNKELALKRSEENFRQLFNLNPDLVNISRWIDGRIIEVNDNFIKELGYGLNEVIGKTTHELNIWVKPEERSLLLQKLEQKRCVENYETELRRKDGSRFNGMISAKVIVFFGSLHILSVTRDITSLKQAEAKLMELNNDKDRFISILAHDLKNPFNVLLGFSSLLAENLRSYTIDTIEAHIKIISETAQSMYELFEEILLWARAQSGKLPFKPVEIDFIESCLEVTEIHSQSAAEKEIEIKHSSQEGLRFWADKNMFKTILRNLLSNAIKFTHPHGCIHINAEQDASSVTITVSDNGVGIKADVMAKLFDITEKVTTTGTAKEKGSGLGLLLCKEFVEKHGGRIWVESEPDKGSRFKFTIPRLER